MGALGFNTYAHFLRSRMWIEKKREYAQSGLPQYCLFCKSRRYILHHVSYTNLGSEVLETDFVPLCTAHHDRIHTLMHLKQVWFSTAREVLEALTRNTRNRAARAKLKDKPPLLLSAATCKETKHEKKARLAAQRLLRKNDPSIVEDYIKRRQIALPERTHREPDPTYRGPKRDDAVSVIATPEAYKGVVRENETRHA